MRIVYAHRKEVSSRVKGRVKGARLEFISTIAIASPPVSPQVFLVCGLGFRWSQQ